MGEADHVFFFDPSDQSLYIKIAGEPAWFSIELGVRGFVLIAESGHDVVIRKLELRHNRQPGGQWPMVSVGQCERVVVEDCRICGSDFCGLGLGRSRECIVRRCDLSYNGNAGLGMGECRDCTIEDCTLLFNNYRRFHSGWHAGGMKCIPGNVRCTIRGCEAAYNIASDGIWFDCDNADIRILGNISHHNDGTGIFYESRYPFYRLGRSGSIQPHGYRATARPGILSTIRSPTPAVSGRFAPCDRLSGQREVRPS